MRSSTSLWGRTLLWIASEMLEILTIILDENALEYLAFGRDLFWIASEMLEFLE